MVIKGNPRGSPRDLARHLLRADTNERVEVAELRGVVARDLSGALREMDAHGAALRTSRTLYHASINTRADERLTDAQRLRAVDELEKALGLGGQARAIVVHEKEGREHCHVVWARTDLEHMRAIRCDHNYRTHEQVARALEQEFGHAKVQGAHVERDDKERPDRTPSHAEMQQAERTGLSPKEAKAQLTALWQATDNGKSFAAALDSQGWALARGDKRDFVALDPTGEVHSLARRIEGAKAKDVKARLADLDPATLPSVAEAREQQERRRETQERQQAAAEITGPTPASALTPQPEPAPGVASPAKSPPLWELDLNSGNVSAGAAPSISLGAPTLASLSLAQSTVPTFTTRPAPDLAPDRAQERAAAEQAVREEQQFRERLAQQAALERAAQERMAQERASQAQREEQARQQQARAAQELKDRQAWQARRDAEAKARQDELARKTREEAVRQQAVAEQARRDEATRQQRELDDNRRWQREQDERARKAREDIAQRQRAAEAAAQRQREQAQRQAEQERQARLRAPQTLPMRAAEQTARTGIRVVGMAGAGVDKVADGLANAAGALLEFMVGGAPPRSFSAADYALNPAARQAYHAQQAALQERDAALERMARDLARENSLSAADLRSLPREDLENIKARGDAHLLHLIRQREEEQKRNRDRGYERERER